MSHPKSMKILFFLVTIILLLFLNTAIASETRNYPEQATEMILGQTVSQAEPCYYGNWYFRYTPSESGVYAIDVSGSGTFQGGLYELAIDTWEDDEYGYEIYYYLDPVQAVDTGVQDNALAFRAWLDAGTEYYFRVGKSSGTGSQTVEACISRYSPLFLAPDQGGKRLFEYGSDVTMTVEAYSSEGDLTYEWAYQEQGEYFPLYTTLDGATEASLTLANLTDEYSCYMCIVSDGISEERVYFYNQLDDKVINVEASQYGTYNCQWDGTIELKAYISTKSNHAFCQWTREWTDENGMNHTELVDEQELEYASESVVTVVPHQDYIPTVYMYTCSVTSLAGDTQRVLFQVNISAPVSGFISVSNREIHFSDSGNYIEIDPGDSLLLTVTASSPGRKLSYKWYKDETPNSSFDEVLINGVTSSTLMTDSIHTTTLLKCVVENEYKGSLASINLLVKVRNDLPALIAEESSVDVNVGDSCILRIDETSGFPLPSYSYQWYTPVFFTTETGTPIEGATQDYFVIPEVTAGGYYACKVSNNAGAEKTVWFHVRITNNYVSVSRTGDRRRTVDAGEDEILEVNAHCCGRDLHYRWFDEYIPIGGGVILQNPIPGATEASYTVSGQVQNKAEYYCEVMCECGNYGWIDYEVTMNDPVILSQFAFLPENETVPVHSNSVTVPYGGTGRLSIGVNCTSDWTGQWYTISHDENASLDIATRIPDATGTVLMIAPVTERTTYAFSACNAYGYSTTREFTVSPNIENLFYAEAAGDTTCNIRPGETALLEVSAYCENGNLDFQWYGEIHDNYGNYCYGPIKGATGPSLSVGDYTRQDAEYECQVTNDYTSTTKTISFTVHIVNDLVLTRAGSEQVTVPPAGQAELEVTASCNAGRITYEWTKLEIYDGNQTSGTLENATGSLITTDPVYYYAEYTCTVRDEYGNTASTMFIVSADNQLHIEALTDTQPTVAPGSTLTMKVLATCLDGEITYQWYKSERIATGANSFTFTYEPIPDATGPEYTTEPLTATDYLQYTCSVSDEYDGQDSVDFLVTVIEFENMALGENRALIGNTGVVRYFSFVPAHTCNYLIESEEYNRYPVVSLYDSSWTEIASDSGSGEPGDGGGSNFRLEVPLTAGHTYYWSIRLLGEGQTSIGSVPFRLREVWTETGDMTLYLGQTASVPSNPDLLDIIVEDPDVIEQAGLDLTGISPGKTTVSIVGKKIIRNVELTVADEDGGLFVLPEDLTEVEAEAFAGNTSVRRIEMGLFVEKVGSRAFAGSGLRQLSVRGYNTVFADDALDGSHPLVICQAGNTTAEFMEEKGYFYLEFP